MGEPSRDGGDKRDRSATAAALGRPARQVLIHARDQARAAAARQELSGHGGRFAPVSGTLDRWQVCGVSPNRCCGRRQAFACAGEQRRCGVLPACGVSRRVERDSGREPSGGRQR